jgi:pentatricopeptide repeat protein
MILNRVLDQYLEGNNDLEPNVATWTIVISAWARLSKLHFNGVADKAEKLLKRMETLHEAGRISFKPDAVAYTVCVNAFAFSKDRDGPSRAEDLLNELNEKFLDGDDSMKVSARAIKAVMDSWIKKGEMDRAEDLLDRYEDLLTSDDSPKTSDELKDIYRSMLYGWCQKGDPSRADFFLHYMVEKEMVPDSFCFDR